MPTELRELIEPDHMAVVTRDKPQGILGLRAACPISPSRRDRAACSRPATGSLRARAKPACRCFARSRAVSWKTRHGVLDPDVSLDIQKQSMRSAEAVAP